MSKKLKNVFRLGLGLIVFASFPFKGHAQSDSYSTLDSLDSKYINWYNLSPKKDKIQGAEVDRTYNELIGDKKPKKKIIVAIIDSGVDINHPELEGRIWTNPNEITGNNIDDDNNGYIDDIHGWGFLGNSKGENIEYENIEEIRIYRDFHPIFKDISSADLLPENQRNDYQIYLKCKEKYDNEFTRYSKMKKNFDILEENLEYTEGIIKEYLNVDAYTPKDLKKIKDAPKRVMDSKEYLQNLYKKGFNNEMFKELKEHVDEQLGYNYNLDFQPRTIINDNPNDINDKNYGNNDVKGPRPDHGTPVSGIIAAVRNNNTGIDGIAENVELMILRVVPNGDERDKDVALAIRYAVDNGANIINMSFGKNFSPHKQFVDEAIMYAEAHNVLLIHAAGNSSEDIDETERFPSQRLNNGAYCQSWITVGANAYKLNKKLCGNFSNFGKLNVDIFAPGVDVVSLSPGNKYIKTDGTSFSGPVVSGVAALIWSYFPELSAIELKEILLQSGTNYASKKVYQPGSTRKNKIKVKFSDLSKTGSIINAYEAFKLAGQKTMKE